MRERIVKLELATRVLHLTLALYRVTNLLPRSEPLQKAMQEKAGEVFSAVISARHGIDAEKEAAKAWIATEILLGYLAMARTLGCANPINFLALEREYGALRAALPADDTVSEKKSAARSEEKKENENKPARVLRQQYPIEDRRGGRDTNDRQRAILGHLAQSGQAKVSDFYEVFGDISSKTIQRDLQDLVVKNLIRKEGDKRWTIYMIV